MNITFNYSSFSPEALQAQAARFKRLVNDQSVEEKLRKYSAEQLEIIEAFDNAHKLT